jgi:hypothetical protein
MAPSTPVPAAFSAPDSATDEEEDIPGRVSRRKTAEDNQEEDNSENARLKEEARLKKIREWWAAQENCKVEELAKGSKSVIVTMFKDTPLSLRQFLNSEKNDGVIFQITKDGIFVQNFNSLSRENQKKAAMAILLHSKQEGWGNVIDVAGSRKFKRAMREAAQELNKGTLNRFEKVVITDAPSPPNILKRFIGGTKRYFGRGPSQQSSPPSQRRSYIPMKVQNTSTTPPPSKTEEDAPPLTEDLVVWDMLNMVNRSEVSDGESADGPDFDEPGL